MKKYFVLLFALPLLVASLVQETGATGIFAQQENGDCPYANANRPSSLPSAPSSLAQRQAWVPATAQNRQTLAFPEGFPFVSENLFGNTGNFPAWMQNPNWVQNRMHDTNFMQRFQQRWENRSSRGGIPAPARPPVNPPRYTPPGAPSSSSNSSPSSSSSSSVASAPSAPANVDQTKQQVLSLVNSERQKAGLQPLAWDGTIAVAAQRHAEDMRQRNFFDHVNPEGQSPVDRMKAAGYNGSAYGENIARGQRSPQQVMDDWMNSPGHRKNILSPNYRKIGIGIAGDVWVQNFGA